jgi:hypothetical protein
MKLTKRQLEYIITKELNEGLFDSFGDVFKSKKTKRAEAAAKAAEIEAQDRQKIREYYKDYLVLKSVSFVDHQKTWHRKPAFVCEDLKGVKTLWYQSQREKITVQIAGLGYYPRPPNSNLAPGHFWLCKSTPLKRPYKDSIEEKIYVILNTYMNGFNSRDALPFPNNLFIQLSDNGKNKFVKLFHEEVGKISNASKIVGFYCDPIVNNVDQDPNLILPAVYEATLEMKKEKISGSDHLINHLKALQLMYSPKNKEKIINILKEKNPDVETEVILEHFDQIIYERALVSHNDLCKNLGHYDEHGGFSVSSFDASWADELYSK